MLSTACSLEILDSVVDKERELLVEASKKIVKVQKIGKGGHAEVFKYCVGETCTALKTQIFTYDCGIPSSAMREIDILLRVDHPGVISIFQHWIEYDSKHQYIIYIDMPLFQMDLLQYTRCLWKNDLFLVLPRIVHRLIDTLAFLHQNGIVHYDIKPYNIMMTSSGMPVLIDFGLGLTSTDTYHSKPCTALYRPPEHFYPNGSQYVNGKADVWALGMTLYEVILDQRIAPVSLEEHLIPNEIFSAFGLSEHFAWDFDVCVQHQYIGSSVRIHLTEESINQKFTIPPKLIDMMCSMLTLHPICRPTMVELLAYPYVADYDFKDCTGKAYPRPLLCSPSNVNHPYDRKRVIRVAQEICHFYQAAVRCVFSAIHIFDQYLRKSTHKHKPPFYDWIMVVAVRLAISSREASFVSIKESITLYLELEFDDSAKKISSRKFSEMEQKMLISVQWNLSFDTVQDRLPNIKLDKLFDLVLDDSTRFESIDEIVARAK